MVEEKGLAPESADKIGGFVNGNAGGAKELWAKLTEENKFGDHPVSSDSHGRIRVAFFIPVNQLRQRSFGVSHDAYSPGTHSQKGGAVTGPVEYYWGQ